MVLNYDRLAPRAREVSEFDAIELGIVGQAISLGLGEDLLFDDPVWSIGARGVALLFERAVKDDVCPVA
jgi:hypothetical protein